MSPRGGLDAPESPDITEARLRAAKARTGISGRQGWGHGGGSQYQADNEILRGVLASDERKHIPDDVPTTHAVAEISWLEEITEDRAA